MHLDDIPGSDTSLGGGQSIKKYYLNSIILDFFNSTDNMQQRGLYSLLVHHVTV